MPAFWCQEFLTAINCRNFVRNVMQAVFTTAGVAALLIGCYQVNVSYKFINGSIIVEER